MPRFDSQLSREIAAAAIGGLVALMAWKWFKSPAPTSVRAAAAATTALRLKTGADEVRWLFSLSLMFLVLYWLLTKLVRSGGVQKRREVIAATVLVSVLGMIPPPNTPLRLGHTPSSPSGPVITFCVLLLGAAFVALRRTGRRDLGGSPEHLPSGHQVAGNR